MNHFISITQTTELPQKVIDVSQEGQPNPRRKGRLIGILFDNRNLRLNSHRLYITWSKSKALFTYIVENVLIQRLVMSFPFHFPC